MPDNRSLSDQSTPILQCGSRYADLQNGEQKMNDPMTTETATMFMRDRDECRRATARAQQVLTEAGIPTHDDHGQPLSLALRIGVLRHERDEVLERLEADGEVWDRALRDMSTRAVRAERARIR